MHMTYDEIITSIVKFDSEHVVKGRLSCADCFYFIAMQQKAQAKIYTVVRASAY